MKRFGENHRGMGSIFDDINNFVSTKVDPLVATGTKLATTVQSFIPSTSTPSNPAQALIQQQQQAAASNPSAPSGSGMSTAAIVGIVLGIAGLGATVYFATKK